MSSRARSFLLVLLALTLCFGTFSPASADPGSSSPTAAADKTAVSSPAATTDAASKAPAASPASKAPAKKFTAPTLPADLTNAYLTLAILIGAAILFFTEALPLPVTAMLVPCALSLFKIISPQQAFANFGEVNVVIFMAMFILGEGTFATGFANRVGEWTIKLSKGSEARLLLYSVISIGALSAFLSNTGTTAMALPMILAMCAAARINPGKILMPVAFASSMGGTITLVGTPPNLLINSALQQMGGDIGIQPFGFFEFAMFGVPLLAMGVLYYATIGRKLLPETKPAVDFSDMKMHEPREMRTRKMGISVAIFIFVVIAMAAKLMPLVTAAMLGALMMIITGCITMKEAFKSIDWTTIFLFAGMISMSTAMQKSGAATLIATSVVQLVSDPYAILAASCAITAIITNFMSNTATAALMAPLAIPIAIQGGVSPLPIAMGIAMSASACFLTPIATPPNTLVFGPGNYSFGDYIKAGWILQVLSFILCMVLIPIIWPF